MCRNLKAESTYGQELKKSILQSQMEKKMKAKYSR